MGGVNEPFPRMPKMRDPAIKDKIEAGLRCGLEQGPFLVVRRREDFSCGYEL